VVGVQDLEPYIHCERRSRQRLIATTSRSSTDSYPRATTAVADCQTEAIGTSKRPESVKAPDRLRIDVLSNVTVARMRIVGAGSVYGKDSPQMQIVVGNPENFDGTSTEEVKNMANSTATIFDLVTRIKSSRGASGRCQESICQCRIHWRPMVENLKRNLRVLCAKYCVGVNSARTHCAFALMAAGVIGRNYCNGAAHVYRQRRAISRPARKSHSWILTTSLHDDRQIASKPLRVESPGV